jgi:predicted DNA binding CopG/RHH family protein
MYEKSILVKCTEEYKNSVKEMAKSRGMSISEFIRFLIEKQKEADRK